MRKGAILLLLGVHFYCSSSQKKDAPIADGVSPVATKEETKSADVSQAALDQAIPVHTNNPALRPLKVDPPKSTKPKKKKRGRFNFSSDEFIKETGANPFESKQDTVMRLNGHAHVISKNMKMNSPVIEIYGDDSHLAYAKGPVDIYDSKSDTRITGNEALFYRSDNRALVRGNAKLVTYTKAKTKKGKRDKITLNADELERNFETSISIARGQVVATSRETVMYANLAEYDEPNDIIRSEKNPRIFTARDVFLADKIAWNLAKNVTEFSGHVRAYLSQDDDATSKKKKKTVASAIRSEEGTLIQDEDQPFGQKLNLRRKVVFEREDHSGFSEDADIYGEGGEWVKAREKVKLINKEDRTVSFGDFFEYLKSTGATKLVAKSGNETLTIMHNSKNEPTYEIKAATVSRSYEKARPQARGKVKINQVPKDKTTEPAKLGSEWAEMFREHKIIEMHGSPYILGSMGRVNAREIILYYEEERYEMLGIQPGIVDVDEEEKK